MKRAFTLFFCVITILLFSLSPAGLLQGLQTNVYTQQAREKQQQYTGNLSLWHIVSFKTGGQSGVSYLRDRIRYFEQKHPYVFIQFTAYTAEEAQQALARGEFPDLISYPLGFFPDPSVFSPLPLPNQLPRNLRTVGSFDGVCYAYPYMADAYTLSIDQDMFFDQDIPLPTDVALDDPALSQLTDFLIQTSASPALGDTASPMAEFSLLHSYALTDMQLRYWQSCRTFSSDSFWEKASPCLLAPAAEILKNAESSANPLSLQTYTLRGYSDLCQCIGVNAQSASDKAAMGQAFCASLLTASAQKALQALYMLPVLPLEALYPDSPLHAQAYHDLQKYGIVPNTFAFAAQLQQPFLQLSDPAAKTLLQKIVSTGK